MLSRFTSKSKGQALVELTLFLPLIIVLIGGLVDFGLAFYVGTATQNAVREGARLAAAGVDNTTVKNQVTARIPAISEFTSVAVNDPVVASSVGCTDSSGNPVTQQTVSVTASGTYNYSFLQYIGFTNMTISRTGIMRVEANSPCY